MEALIKTEKYDFIMEQLMEATNFYSYNASSSNNYNITKLYSNVTKKILHFYKESQIVNRLKTILPALNPKVSPLLSIFLLFFIYPCNRKKIIKYIYLSLDYINHQGIDMSKFREVIYSFSALQIAGENQRLVNLKKTVFNQKRPQATKFLYCGS